ncbi:hypothetical protein D8674_007683 [Pyrus ussuriensis x Pyrus communis]|uniref:Mitochondrial Rho GTPase n=1 Tax=Pyrus ussuriensis x Pyrus communis TaxID=2448454 RepID=A0A5N5I3J1_9ROSA|nr:hypothetical protein D8674_007683 [Pyrus ussuriensis x Pyrus communis]
MTKVAAGNDHPVGQNAVRIVVAGDRGTGKSSLIVTAATENFPANVPPVLPPTRLPEDFYPERVPITIIDTSSRPEDTNKVAEELKRADAVVLTYACNQPQTLDRLSTFWLPKLRQLEVKVPVIVVGCKLDLRDENQQVSLEQVMSPIMQQFREIETCIECSAYKHIQIPEVFYYAQKAVLHPTGPLFDQETQTLKDQCVRALKRIFILCDHDRDGALSDAELNDFQVKCFNAPLQPSEIVGVKRVVQEKLPEGVNEHGLTLTGFLFLHALFIEKGRLETTWTVLRKFGYNNEIRLADELIPSPTKRTPDQSVELTNEAIEFLKANFDLFDNDGDGALRPRELEELFSTAPASPFSEHPYKDAAEKNAFGGLSLDGFLSQWALMTLLNPASTMENLIYIGYPGDVSSTIRVTRKRRLDRKKQQSERNVFQCFVFGPKKAGKSALLDSFLGRPFSDTYNPTTGERYAVNVVDQPGGPKKTLVMREIPEDGVEKFLRNKEALAACDIAVFVHDSSDESSWRRATELLIEVASHGETTGFEVPCLIVAAKDDLDAFPSAIQHSTRVSQDMGTEAPIPISTKLGDFNNVFRKIVTAAEHPHLSIPETEAGRTRKQYHKILNRSLMFISVGAAVAMVGVAAYRVYSARKNASIPSVLYLIILSLFFLCLIISFNFRPTKSNNCATIRNQQVIKNETKNERKNVDWFVAISKLFKIKGRKIKVGLVNVDEHIHSQLHGLSDVEAVSVAFERVARDRKWKDYFPEWIDEDEKWGKPKCPEIPIPKLEHYEGIDVVLAKVPCGPNGTSDREGIRDVFRLQVNLMVANLVVGKGWMKPDAHRTVYIVFIGDCGPMVEIFRCDDLLMHRGNYWVYRPNIGRLKQIVHMPVGSCQVASGYVETGREIWRKFMLETSSWIPYEKRRLAYVTILHSSEAYVCGAIALARSIRQTNSTKDLVLLADDFITPKSIQGLTAAGWKIKRIQRIRSAFAKKGSYNEWNYSKLRVWQLTEYDKVIFIDADLLVLKNIDSFFVHQQLSAVGNNRVLFNSGLMVVEPSNCMFEYLMQKTSKLESYNGGDQGFLNEIFTWWHRLPWRLNALKCFGGSKGANHEMAEDLYAIHYLGFKPWVCYRDYDCNWEGYERSVFASDSAHEKWWKVYDQMPQKLKSYCGLTKKMDENLKTRRVKAAKANYSDGHWKIVIKDPRQHHLYT